MAFAHFVVVEIVRGRDFHAARAEIFFHVFVGNHGNGAACQRQHQLFADKVRVTFVFGMHGHRHVAQHGFGAGGGDDEAV